MAEQDAVELGEVLAFWGQVTATMSHEMSNAIGTVNQATGLLGDLLDGSDASGSVDRERLNTIRERLDRQVSRATDLVHALSYLAHTVDHRAAGIELGAVARNAVTLSRRLASLQGVELQLDEATFEVRLEADQFGLLWLLFAALECLYECAESGTEIVVAVVDAPASVIMRTSRQCPDPARLQESLCPVQLLAARLGCDLILEQPDGNVALGLVPGPRRDPKA